MSQREREERRERVTERKKRKEGKERKGRKSGREGLTVQVKLKDHQNRSNKTSEITTLR